MAFATAMRRASSSSSLLARFLNSASNPSAAAATVTTRSFSSSYSSSVPIVDSNDENCTISAHGSSFTRSEQFPIQRGIWDPYMENPFQISGPRGAYEAKKVEEGLFVRMEMPGIEKDDVKVWVDYRNVYVKGEGKKESKHEDSGRTYSASLEVSSNSFQPEKIKAEMRNGVLRMLIPKTNKFEETAGRCEVRIE